MGPPLRFAHPSVAEGKKCFLDIDQSQARPSVHCQSQQTHRRPLNRNLLCMAEVQRTTFSFAATGSQGRPRGYEAIETTLTLFPCFAVKSHFPLRLAGEQSSDISGSCCSVGGKCSPRTCLICLYWVVLPARQFQTFSISRVGFLPRIIHYPLQPRPTPLPTALGLFMLA